MEWGFWLQVTSSYHARQKTHLLQPKKKAGECLPLSVSVCVCVCACMCVGVVEHVGVCNMRVFVCVHLY